MKIRGEYSSKRIWIDDKELLPEESQKVFNHSPDGFNWGYGGSGPSQLALAILLLFTNKEKALKIYHKFKWDFITSFPIKDFEQEININEWLSYQKKEK